VLGEVILASTQAISGALFVLVGATSVYLLVIAGVHALADRGMARALPALVVVLALWVIGLLGLGPGTSVLLVGLALAISLADHVRRTNRSLLSA
jgi:hypothetical protein